jgi:hypothetical protein
MAKPLPGSVYWLEKLEVGCDSPRLAWLKGSRPGSSKNMKRFTSAYRDVKVSKYLIGVDRDRFGYRACHRVEDLLG